MAEFNPPKNETEFERNFAPIKPDMNTNEAYHESSRCLNCYDAPCVAACPTGIDIPLFIKQINTENVMGAAKTIYESNYLANVCGKVCPTEVLCEGACVYNHQDTKPIEIGRLQSFASSKAIKENKKLFTLAPDNGKKVAVIGAGPAGLANACELRLLGFTVDIFEAKSLASGLAVHGVAPYKLTNNEALDEVDYLQKQFGFNLYLNKPITTKEQIEKLENDYDAIFLGMGLGKTSVLNLEGENLPQVKGAVEFVEELRSKHADKKVPARIVVLGGGNTAMDAASESARMGAAEVTLAYRRGKDEMGAYHFEYDLAKAVGVMSLFNASPKAILGADKVEGVQFVKTEMQDGKLVEIANSEFVVECDAVIKATGQSKHTELFALMGIKVNAKNCIEVSAHLQCSKPNYFAAGDAVSGGQEVVNAAADGKKAAQQMYNYLLKNN